VLVMGIATAWIVAVAVGMMQSLMAMNVTVLLAQQQHDAGGHEPRSQQQGR
jgi:cell division protein FtsN